jgi:8-oxo-dGTP pyrophosphatase MutT (NUDIX family)
VTDEELPAWWSPLLERAGAARTEDFTILTTPAEGRASAVLVLLGETDGRPDILLLQRAADMRNHAGQPAFPGGASDPGEDAVATALREAAEETGLDPKSVEVLAELPPLWIPVSNFIVTPVLAWWRDPHPVSPLDAAEVELVARVPVDTLVNPVNRLRVRHPSGWIGQAFRTERMLVWGFTAGVLGALLDMAGWAVPWDQLAPPVDLPL